MIYAGEWVPMVRDSGLWSRDTSGMTPEELHQYYLEITSEEMEPPGDSLLDAEGALVKEARPAAYLDTSAVIDYWWTEGADMPEGPEIPDTRALIRAFLREQFNTKRTTDGFDVMAKVREALIVGQSDLLLVTTPLALLELQSYMSEGNIRYWLQEALGAAAMERRGRKEIGDILLCCHDSHNSATGELRDALSWLQADGILVPSYVASHGLWGVSLVNVRQFDLTVSQFWQTAVWLMSYVQIGAADVLHACVAKHLGCRYFVSFDADFKRVREEMASEMDLELICNPQQLLDVTRRHAASRGSQEQ